MLSNHHQIASLLLANGTDINKRNKDGWTVLMLAAWNNESLVKLLLEKQADPSIKAGGKLEGKTALDFAKQSSKDEIVAMLSTAPAPPAPPAPMVSIPPPSCLTAADKGDSKRGV